jgi:hypothetical protein
MAWMEEELMDFDELEAMHRQKLIEMIAHLKDDQKLELLLNQLCFVLALTDIMRESLNEANYTLHNKSDNDKPN